MLDAFTARLEACDPARGHFRAYRIDAGTDLFGDWLVDVTYGRIGSRGRTIRHVAADEAQARRIVRYCLQRRGTAKKRIGVGYQFCELIDPGKWIGEPLLQSGLSAMITHAAGAALAGHRTDRDRLPNIAACRAYLPCQAEHPRT